MIDSIELRSNLSTSTVSEDIPEKENSYNPYIIHKETLSRYRKKNYPQSMAFRCSFTSNGKFITRGSFDKKCITQSIVISQIVPNASLVIKDDKNEEKRNDPQIKFFYCRNYYKYTMIYFLSTFNEYNTNNMLSKKNSMNEMSELVVNEGFADLSLSVLSEMISHYVDSIKENSFNISNLANIYEVKLIYDTKIDIERLKYINEEIIRHKIYNEINVLVLVNILFLNPFYEEKMHDFVSMQISNEHYMKKRKLTEWLYTATRDV